MQEIPKNLLDFPGFSACACVSACVSAWEIQNIRIINASISKDHDKKIVARGIDMGKLTHKIQKIKPIS